MFGVCFAYPESPDDIVVVDYLVAIFECNVTIPSLVLWSIHSFGNRKTKLQPWDRLLRWVCAFFIMCRYGFVVRAFWCFVVGSLSLYAFIYLVNLMSVFPALFFVGSGLPLATMVAATLKFGHPIWLACIMNLNRGCRESAYRGFVGWFLSFGQHLRQRINPRERWGWMEHWNLLFICEVKFRR